MPSATKSLTSRNQWSIETNTAGERSLLERDMAFSIQGNSNAPCVMSVRRAEGIWLEDSDGRRVADLYGNNAHHIGYRHPVLVAALHRQLDQLTLAPRGLTSETSIELGETLARMWGDPNAKVGLTPSGGDANDAAICVAKAATNRYKTISFYDSFHGRNAGALSVGGGYNDRRMLGPVMPGTLKVPPPWRHGDEHLGLDEEDYARHSLNAMRTVFEYERDIAAVVAETIRNYAHVPPDWFWGEVRALCDEYGALMVMDEIATGLGKTGQLFNHERFGFRPDVTTVGKALGGAAMPVAGMIINPDLDLPQESDIGYVTHEKNAMSARAALTTLQIMETAALADRSKSLGEIARVRLDEVASRHASVREVRSAGLMLTLDFRNPSFTRGQAEAFAEATFRACVEGGVLPVFPHAGSITFSMPLVISEEDLSDSIEVIDKSLAVAETH